MPRVLDGAAEALNNQTQDHVVIDNRKATEVLRDKMLFYDTKAKNIIKEIMVKLKEENAPGAMLAMMYKNLKEVDATVIDCASKLANYEAPKLESVTMKVDHEHRYVMRLPAAPGALNTSKAWLDDIGYRAPTKVIEHQTAEEESEDEEDWEEGIK